MKLRPYKNCDANYILNWIKDEKSYYQWCAGLFGEYPVTERKVNEYYEKLQNNDAYWGMTAEDDRGVVGHISMRFVDVERETVRLGFVLVDYGRRGQGLGKELVTMGTKYAREFLGAKQITLGVYAENIAARKCYESVGFVWDNNRVEKYQIRDEVWDCIEMILIPKV